MISLDLNNWAQFCFNLSEKISLDISCEASARQMIHMKCQASFSLKKKKSGHLQQFWMALLGLIKGFRNFCEGST